MTTGEARKGPIFVVGVARSGTTLLRYMLCSHPRIYVPPESNFIPRFFRRHPDEPISRARAERILEQIGNYKTFWRDWREEPIDAGGFIDGLPNLMPASLIDALYSRYARQYGAARWGDKSTIYPAWVDLFVRMFPTCQIVHIIRDARDVTASSLDAYRGPRFFYMDPYYATRMWRERLGRGIEAGRRLPQGAYHEIRYEDLTADPEGKLRELCAFLHEEFHPAMLEPDAEAIKHYHSFGIHQRVRGKITTARSGRWRKDLSPADRRLVQRVAGELLPQLGYPLEDLGSEGIAERSRAAALRAKFEVVNLARSALQASGVFNPARMLLSLPRRRATGARPSGGAAGGRPVAPSAETGESARGDVVGAPASREEPR